MGIRDNREGLSPIVATVILTAVAIIAAATTAWWMSYIAGLHTRFEKIEVFSAYAVSGNLSSGGEGWIINVKLRNMGSSETTIGVILINGKSWSQYNSITIRADGRILNPGEGIPVGVGQTVELTVEIPKRDFDPN